MPTENGYPTEDEWRQRWAALQAQVTATWRTATKLERGAMVLELEVLSATSPYFDLQFPRVPEIAFPKDPPEAA